MTDDVTDDIDLTPADEADDTSDDLPIDGAEGLPEDVRDGTIDDDAVVIETQDKEKS